MSDLETKKVDVADLPWNYLPQALIEEQDKTSGFFQIIPTTFPNEASEITFTVNSETFRALGRSSKELSEGLSEKIQITKQKLAKNGPYFVAPKTQDSGEIAFVRGPTEGLTNQSEKTETITIIGLIDFGIAFWNPRFSDTAFADKFLDIGYLSFDASGGTRPLVSFLGRAGIDRYGTVLSTHGEAQLIKDLGNDYPQSVFAPSSLTADGGPPFQPRNVNHGTAMADLACCANPNAKLIAIELPTNVVLDSTGSYLTFVAGLALESLISRATELAAGQRLELKILFPFGFSGGPQDGTHPVADQIQSALELYPHVTISLMIPMGNQRQDQIHADLGKIDKGEPSKPLYWFVEPGDESANSFDLFIKGSDAGILRLKPPCAAHIEIPFQDRLFYWVWMDGNLIGAVHCSKSTNGDLRARLSLRSSSSSIDLSGAWQVQVLASEENDIENASLWILRDFAPYFGRAHANQRPSRFVDERYVKYGDDGLFLLDDTQGSLVQRQGSASVLATVPHVTSVGAQEKRENTTETAFYSGAFKSEADNPRRWKLVDPKGPASGQTALGNGTPRRFKVTGTSVATAQS